MTIVLFILVFGLIVISHELGHFILAKVNGIHVVEFAIGMGPKLLHFNKNGTQYAIRLFPIGGACIFEGEDGKNESDDTNNKETEGSGLVSNFNCCGRTIIQFYFSIYISVNCCRLHGI